MYVVGSLQELVGLCLSQLSTQKFVVDLVDEGAELATGSIRIVKIDVANNLLYIKGAVPGARNGLILIQNQNLF